MWKKTKLATISEQMRLLYVAMTRAELKLYLVGKVREDKLRDTDWGTSRNGKLDPEKRKEWTSYQDWLFAIQDVFTKNTLAYDTRFVTDEDLTPDQLEPLERRRIPGLISSRMSVSQRIFVGPWISWKMLIGSISSMLRPFIYQVSVLQVRSRNSTSRSWMPMASRSWMQRV